MKLLNFEFSARGETLSTHASAVAPCARTVRSWYTPACIACAQHNCYDMLWAVVKPSRHYNQIKTLNVMYRRVSLKFFFPSRGFSFIWIYLHTYWIVDELNIWYIASQYLSCDNNSVLYLCDCVNRYVEAISKLYLKYIWILLNTIELCALFLNTILVFCLLFVFLRSDMGAIYSCLCGEDACGGWSSDSGELEAAVEAREALPTLEAPRHYVRGKWPMSLNNGIR